MSREFLPKRNSQSQTDSLQKKKKINAEKHNKAALIPTENIIQGFFPMQNTLAEQMAAQQKENAAQLKQQQDLPELKGDLAHEETMVADNTRVHTQKPHEGIPEQQEQHSMVWKALTAIDNFILRNMGIHMYSKTGRGEAPKVPLDWGADQWVNFDELMEMLTLITDRLSNKPGRFNVASARERINDMLESKQKLKIFASNMRKGQIEGSDFAELADWLNKTRIKVESLKVEIDDNLEEKELENTSVDSEQSDSVIATYCVNFDPKGKVYRRKKIHKTTKKGRWVSEPFTKNGKNN